MLRVWSCFSARRAQLDVAVDVEDPGARAVARERSDGRDVAVPCRRRRVMPALRDDAGEAGAGHGRVAELVLDDGERLAVLRARRRREVGLRQERVDRRGEVDAGCGGEAERGPAASGGHEGCSTARSPRSPGPAPGDFAGNVSSSRTTTWRAAAIAPAPPSDPPLAVPRLRGEWVLPRESRTLPGGDRRWYVRRTWSIAFERGFGSRSGTCSFSVWARCLSSCSRPILTLCAQRTTEDFCRSLVMGDSYSAGNGAGGYIKGSPSKCYRSSKNYAREFARLVEKSGQRVFVENVACSGAETTDFFKAATAKSPLWSGSSPPGPDPRGQQRLRHRLSDDRR